MHIQTVGYILFLCFIHTAYASLAPAHNTCAHCGGFNVFETTLPGYPTWGKCNYYNSATRESCLVDRAKEYYGCQGCQQYSVQNRIASGDGCTHTNKQKIGSTPQPQAPSHARAKLHRAL
ncbi:hypothetical protein PGT21_015416 [Puccinia graminis f. sp. tritici]|uniref:Secreted protein n=1 Tax=Puccinia graminis f. sp. tritici TaxID=56615 RepID=A0A5B0QTH0_PUCGR|nr:hypothetical protein PGT21_015416 [Puccinia graminis f. sp. tritici]KAA1121866.1 hypothetical protein PGTUg99_034266 [Puccinia graminis f. sp. tritici]